MLFRSAIRNVNKIWTDPEIQGVVICSETDRHKKLVLSGAGAKTGHLDSKTRELIAVAVAITLRCDGCIAVHSAEAKKLGATKEEIAEALGVGISVNAGAALVYSTRTVDAYDAAT